MVAFLKSAQQLGRKVKSFVDAEARDNKKTKKGGKESRREAKLDLISANFHYGCMGLPQEIVDYIMKMLHDDLPALEACSLTCKSMFASTRHLIHQTLYLIPENDYSILPRRKIIYWKRRYIGPQFRFLSYMGERGFLRYTRRVNILPLGDFTPSTLSPHFNHFRSLDRVHSLSITHFEANAWVPDKMYKTYFTHFYSTLTSLTLLLPSGDYRLLLQFILQFPNLEDLCLEGAVEGGRWEPTFTLPTIIDQSPALRGNLRLSAVDGRTAFVKDLALKLKNGINFRSFELDDIFGRHALEILHACSHSLEDLIMISPRVSPSLWLCGLHPDVLSELRVLRRLTLSVYFDDYFMLELNLLLATFLTVTSPGFHEFVIEILDLPPRDNWRALAYDDSSREAIDRCFLSRRRFGPFRDFKIIVRTTPDSPHREVFQKYVSEKYIAFARRGTIHYETALKLSTGRS